MNCMERLHLGTSRVHLEVETSDFSWLVNTPAEYIIQVRRKDEMPLTEIELRSLLTNLAWAADGEDSLIDLHRHKHSRNKVHP